MWTIENRPRQPRQAALSVRPDREEWALIEPLIPPAKHGGRRRWVVVREVMNGVMYVLSTGCQWRYLPKDLPPKSIVHDYLTDGIMTARSKGFITRCMCSAERQRGGRLARPPA